MNSYKTRRCYQGSFFIYKRKILGDSRNVQENVLENAINILVFNYHGDL